MRALLALALVCLAAAAARAEIPQVVTQSSPRGRDLAPHESPEPAGCQHDGRWYRAGAPVPGVGDACLRCACAGGALACSRRSCAPLPAPPPPRCHVRHRRGECCPELHCPDSVTTMERGSSGRSDSDNFLDGAGAAQHPLLHACVEDGAVFQAGSALHSNVSCEQCFCLRGSRRCVRPRCLPAPPGCRAPPPAGVCCPQRYHCDHPPAAHHQHLTNNTHDCLVEGVWVAEGERVPAAETRRSCTTCFCLRGAVRCRPLACARALLGCQPELRAGECCPHKYTCPHGTSQFESEVESSNYLLNNALTSVGGEDRSFYAKTSREEESLNVAHTNFAVTTSKVKRKTNDIRPTMPTIRRLENYKIAKTGVTSTTDDDSVSTTEMDTTTETGTESERTSIDEMESYVKTVINGTINCTTEYTSSQPVNISLEELARISAESEPRVPSHDPERDEHSFDPNDLITDRNDHGIFEDKDTFTINVTSSLHANPLSGTPGSVVSVPKINAVQHSTVNNSKKTKEDYDYDYGEPTLPPSLPNLKIIPFVAADAVLDEEPIPKDVPTYPVLERDDKFPVYYPKVEKDTAYANRREDVYEPQYPLYAPEKTEAPEAELPSISYAGLPGVNDLTASLHQYALSASIGSSLAELAKSITAKPDSHSVKESPLTNLFSPPVETEGGFVPKGPGIINEYYAVYPSTPAGPHVPHLTTSMQLDTDTDECISSDGRRIPDGDTVSISCSVCSCAWGSLHCSPRPCPTPAGCRRRPPAASGHDLCCGEIVCSKANNTTTSTTTTTTTTTTEHPTTTPKRFIATTAKHKTGPNVSTTTAPVVTTTVSTSPAVTTRTFISSTTESVKIDIESQEDNRTKINDTETKDNRSTISVTNSTNTSSVNPQLNETLQATTIPPSAVVFTTPEAPVEEEAEPEPAQGSQEYEEEEEEEEEEGFSFGSVLKLLLSDSYDSSTEPPRRRPAPVPTTATPAEDTTTTTTSTTTSTTTMRTPSSSYRPSTTTTVKPFSSSFRPSSTRRPLPKPTLAPFIPMPPQHQLYSPPNTFLPPTSVNRIDHLVLGEATAIKKTTIRPVPTFRPFSLRPVVSRPPSTTRRPFTTKPPEVNTAAGGIERPDFSPPGLVGGNSGAGLLKLAGCNIYGRMYSVGRVIAELAAPCRECRCTELGVQCRDLPC